MFIKYLIFFILINLIYPEALHNGDKAIFIYEIIFDIIFLVALVIIHRKLKSKNEIYSKAQIDSRNSVNAVVKMSIIDIDALASKYPKTFIPESEKKQVETIIRSNPVFEIEPQPVKQNEKSKK